MGLKSRLANGETCCGLMVTTIGGSDVIEVAAREGLDFLMFDEEHFPIAEAELAVLCELTTLRHISPLVRVPSPEPAVISRALDMGAEGVMIPQCRTLDEVRDTVSACYYPPRGRRGFSLRSPGQRLQRLRGGMDDHAPSSVLVESQNASTTVIVQLETQSLLEKLAQGPLPEGVDVLFVGARDLGVDRGTPNWDNTPSALGALIPTTSSPTGGRPYGAVTGKGAIAPWVESGFTFLILGHDLEFFEAGLQARLRAAYSHGETQ
jgi:4-hydroxy-2-oxoheptanedioate aldolase